MKISRKLFDFWLAFWNIFEFGRLVDNVKFQEGCSGNGPSYCGTQNWNIGVKLILNLGQGKFDFFDLEI